MKAPHTISMRSRNKDPEKAYGAVKRIKKLEEAFWLEDMADALSPMPTTYDVLPVQSYYFSEIGYTDLWGGLYLYPMSFELAARIMEQSVQKRMAEDLSKVREPVFEDKYHLRIALKTPKKIIFLPGSNLLHIIDFNQVEKLLFSDDEIMVKPHPIMTTEGLRLLGSKLGFDRIIDPKDSGMMLLENCERAWGTANSEIGLHAALLKIPYSDVTNTQYGPYMSYAAIHRLFNGDVEHDRKVVLAAIDSVTSGLIMSWHSEEEAAHRMKCFFDTAMAMRQQYRPMYPVSVPIAFGPAREGK